MSSYITIAIVLLLAAGLIPSSTHLKEESYAPASIHAAAPFFPPKSWADMDRAERKDYMRDVVQPRMRTLFAAFDKKKYAEINCVTCHPAGARTGEYAMPDPKLSKLPSTAAGYKTLNKKKPGMMKFMNEKVKPEMAALLGITPDDPNGGYGCANCHTSKQ